MSDRNSNHESWEKFLNPTILRDSLISVSLYITAFELFKTQVISKPETFFSEGFDKDGLILGKEYEREVMSKSKSKLYASLLWIKENGGIDEDDLKLFDSARLHRNELAHQILRYISDSQKNVDPMLLTKLIALLAKIEKWWFQWFELAIQPDLLPDGADPDDVVAGPIWSLQMMLDIALGDDEKSSSYYKEWLKIRGR